MIFNKLELDVMQVNELRESVELAFKHKFPTLVVHANLAADAIRARGAVRGQFKIITPLDWPKGENYGKLKLRGVPMDAIETDGFEIMLTGGRTEGETRAEALMITEFVKKQLSEQMEVRFVLGTAMRDDAAVETLCRGLLHVRTPAMIRTDTPLKLQVSKANADEHQRLVKLIRGIVQAPVKVSGNIQGVRSITGCPEAARYAVNLVQAKTIIKEFQSQPGGLKELLNSASPRGTVVELEADNDTTVH